MSIFKAIILRGAGIYPAPNDSEQTKHAAVASILTLVTQDLSLLARNDVLLSKVESAIPV